MQDDHGHPAFIIIKSCFKACESPKKRSLRSMREQRVLAFYAEQQGGKAMLCGLIYLT